MTLQFTNNEGHAIITLCGRLDTSSAMQTQTEINQFLSAQSPILSVTVNAAELEYVSSSGLRILLSSSTTKIFVSLIKITCSNYNVLKISEMDVSSA